MKPEELAKQRESLHGNAEFVKYVQNHSGADQAFNDKYRNDAFSKMSGKQRAIWAANQIQP
jgi:hypothetical protein